MTTAVSRLHPRRLPNRFPLGTRFVIEGRAGRINSKYLEFPDGRQIDLPTGPAIRSALRRARGDRATGRKSGARKF